MAHIELNHADMKPSALVRYSIAVEQGRAKRLLVAAFIASAMIVVVAAMFLTGVR